MKTIIENTIPASSDNVTQLPVSNPQLTPSGNPPSILQDKNVDLQQIQHDLSVRSRLESLKRKQRSDAFLHSLNVDQACQVVAWMDQFPDLSVVRKCITAPPPEGFGIQVSIAALRRLRSHWHAMDCSRAVEQMMDLVTDLEETVHQHQTPRVQNVIALLLHERALELARTAPGSDVLKDVLTSIDKLSALEHKRLKIALDREKFRRPHQTLPPSAPAPRHHRVDLHVISNPAPQPITPPVLP